MRAPILGVRISHLASRISHLASRISHLAKHTLEKHEINNDRCFFVRYIS